MNAADGEAIVPVVVVGQLMPLLLTLTNMGDAPAKYITLSSNASVVPTNVSILSSSVTKEGKLTTVFRLPVTPLGPNETREVELTLRVPDNGVGPQDVFVMIEYSDQEDIPQDIGTCVLLCFLSMFLLGFFLFSSFFLFAHILLFLLLFLLFLSSSHTLTTSPSTSPSHACHADSQCCSISVPAIVCSSHF